MAARTWGDPIFIGGPSRSGTTMMSQMLRAHPAIHVTRETHYFDDLRSKIRGESLAALEPAARDKALDYFRALSDRPYGLKGEPERGWLERAALLAAAEACGGRLDSLFEAFCKLFAEREKPGARHWGEKTPRNVFRIDVILAAFPKARILCMLRDPRACIASYRDWSYHGGWGAREKDADFMAASQADYDRARLSYHILIAALMWRGVANAAFAGAARHGPDRVRVVRYEDVVADPEGALRGIADWIGVGFDPAMLEVALVNSSGSAFAAKAGVSADPLERWRAKLSDGEVHVIQRVAAGPMARLGYAPQPVQAGALALLRAWAGVPFAAVRAVRANSGRAGNVPAYIWRRIRAAMR